jgi:hypothetical protein
MTQVLRKKRIFKGDTHPTHFQSSLTFSTATPDYVRDGIGAYNSCRRQTHQPERLQCADSRLYSL